MRKVNKSTCGAQRLAPHVGVGVERISVPLEVRGRDRLESGVGVEICSLSSWRSDSAVLTSSPSSIESSRVMFTLLSSSPSSSLLLSSAFAVSFLSPPLPSPSHPLLPCTDSSSLAAFEREPSPFWICAGF